MRPSVFTIAQQESISIEKFIFHIIYSEEDNPRFLDRVDLTTAQKEFFKKRFIDASTGTKFRFIDQENSPFCQDCFNLFRDDNAFLRSSRLLTTGFHQVHKRSANNGVFIISIVSMLVEEEEINLAFLIKMDHTSVYQYKLNGRVATFEEILNTVVEEKSAMQKVAIIDFSENFGWDVLATDRTKSDDVAGYFKDFLTVTELEPASKLTRSFVLEMKKWARINFSSLPDGTDPQYFGDKATDYMLASSNFESEEFIGSVTSDFQNETDIYSPLQDSIRSYLQENELYGVEFSPKPNSLASKEFRKTLRTAEGVNIEWLGSSVSKNIEIPDTRDRSDNLYHITIKTHDIKML